MDVGRSAAAGRKKFCDARSVSRDAVRVENQQMRKIASVMKAEGGVAEQGRSSEISTHRCGLRAEQRALNRRSKSLFGSAIFLAISPICQPKVNMADLARFL